MSRRVTQRAVSIRALALGWLLAALLAPAASRAAPDARLAARLDAETAAAVSRIVEEAATAGLPTEPLVAKALEGAAKGAPGARILSVVQQYAAALGAARSSLGPRSTESEIVAGAGALLVGVPRDTLVGLRATRIGQSLTIPLVVLADLVARKIPASAASAAVLSASRAGVRDGDLLRLRERVEQDIRQGESPLRSLQARSRALTGAAVARPPGPGSPRQVP